MPLVMLTGDERSRKDHYRSISRPRAKAVTEPLPVDGARGFSWLPERSSRRSTRWVGGSGGTQSGAAAAEPATVATKKARSRRRAMVRRAVH